MDRKTHLTMYVPEFTDSWNNYKKGLKGLKITNWCISSDYCFGDPNKLDTATFTIFPADYIPILSKEIKENLPHDIKQTKEFSERELNYLKNSKYFFSISFIVNDIERCFNKNVALLHCKRLLKIQKEDIPFAVSNEDFHKNRQRLQEFLNSLQKKSCPIKLFAQMYFVAHSVAQIIEFLLIKENVKTVGWCSDRGAITTFNHGMVFNLVQMYVHSYVKDRINEYHLAIPPTYQNEIDYFIRIPDIITGALSSLTSSSKGFSAQKVKHQQLILDSFMNNKKIVSLVYNVDKDGLMYGDRIVFETSDQCPLFKFEREQLERSPLFKIFQTDVSAFCG